ncbi:hypothetical protein NHX12_020273 [Muraenolepis orangiensis]|uniref:Uncharacterized protein n=1 Tax=Muraenolepis orangiensis TaxID=630683 RepID=A0A9Q0IUW8_9TELE|nr:hypothetical protein NHX12_020273 [Muraenolepis orangiensis]
MPGVAVVTGLPAPEHSVQSTLMKTFGTSVQPPWRRRSWRRSCSPEAPGAIQGEDVSGVRDMDRPDRASSARLSPPMSDESAYHTQVTKPCVSTRDTVWMNGKHFVVEDDVCVKSVVQRQKS